ncbi:MAG: phage tail protein, partial [Rickettsiales bacterium]|nr:phage tail protein [Rickettsiales bacterium]
ANDTATLRLSLVLSEVHARAVAATTLADRWAERSSLVLQLPMVYAVLETGDVLTLVDGVNTYRIRVIGLQIGRPGIVKMKGVIDAAQAWDGYIAPTVGSNGALVLPNPKTRLEILDLPALPSDTQDVLRLRFAATGIADGWKGATLVRVMPSGDDEILLSLDQPATIGAAISVLSSNQTQRFDEINTVDVALLGDAMLANATELSVLNGANVAVLGNEVFQFKNATQLSAGVYRLSGLLRGRLGTEEAVTSHALGERFVLLNEAVESLTIPVSNNGQSWTIRAVTVGDALGDGLDSTFTIRAEGLKPLAPVLPLAKRLSSSGDIVLIWVRRARIDAGLRDYVDVPLAEQSELYDVKVMNGAAVVHSWRVSSPTVTYTAAEQIADFGISPTSLTIEVTQLSGLIGPGKPLLATIAVQ